MSYDIYTTINTGNDNEVEAGFDRNYTYNVAKMLYDALPGDQGLNALDGTPASEMLGILDIAIKNFEMCENLYRSWEPDNGWGDYDGILELIRDLRDHCEKHPLVTVRVC